jgi:large subunit ribosomal protein L6
MSRIGKQPITLPSNTTLTPQEGQFVVVGPKGTLEVPMLEGVTVKQEEQTLVVTADTEESRAYQGLIRTLIQNAVTGVNTGWKKDLELQGVGLRAALAGTDLNLSLGFSHPIIVPAPEGITFTVTKNIIGVAGIDKQLVGETAAKIRQLRKPEPYKGKGIRYSGEYVRRKAGKTGKAGK